ncbi:hypothetical protein PISMIDRAFT_546276 [Pisolithus microcarpus 441]|uniref:Uncharacterized protein n=1 Tax=Pisolithus microcarpus 441 TaxID=765257 RepID=A0A0C9XF42_9AGAM|nr:hypothetical protein PISMIDRAFT_546276 [Pisolithus microcarpus 441]
MGRIPAVMWISEARRRLYLAGLWRLESSSASGRLSEGDTGSAVLTPRKRLSSSGNDRCA